jgi:putative transposase
MAEISSDLLKYFKGFCSTPSIIMLFVYMKCHFSSSYRELEEMMSIRGVNVDHSTLQLWVRRFTKLIDKRVRSRKKLVNCSWGYGQEVYKIELEVGLSLQSR